MKVTVPPALRRFTGGVAEVAVEGTTVREALGSLFVRHAHLDHRVLNERGEVYPYLLVFVNDAQATLDTPVSVGDEIEIVAAASGG
ncbi:MAG: MoaD/ThiS family protein [Planctomycetota bacterium]